MKLKGLTFNETPGPRCGIKGGVIVEAVTEAIVDWLHQEAAAIRLQTILVHAGKLAELELNLVVQHRVLQTSKSRGFLCAH